MLGLNIDNFYRKKFTFLADMLQKNDPFYFWLSYCYWSCWTWLVKMCICFVIPWIHTVLWSQIWTPKKFSYKTNPNFGFILSRFETWLLNTPTIDLIQTEAITKSFASPAQILTNPPNPYESISNYPNPCTFTNLWLDTLIFHWFHESIR